MAARASDAPRVRVAALVTIDGRIVVVRHRAGDARYHLLPGGGVAWGETLEEALIRELAEETGLVCEIDRPLVINDTIDPMHPRHVVNITFTARVTGGAITSAPSDHRVEGVELIAPDDLMTLDLRPPIAEWLVAAVADPEGFQAVYAGSVFTPEAGSA